jgi:glutaredoxin
MVNNKNKEIVEQCNFKQGTLFELEYQFREYNINLSKRIEELDTRIKKLEGNNEVVPTIKKEVVKDITFLKELIDIKGIGTSFAEDIINVFPNKELLVKAINSNSILPFNSKVCKLLRDKYGGTK